jgi:hypothetical protein
MDLKPDDIAKAVPEVKNIVALIVGGIPVAEIVKSILVPPAAALGKRMADRVDRLFEKTGEMIVNAGIKPKPVSDKLLIEIVRGASVEDNENLHTMWAALLAHAASPEADHMRPAFLSALRNMSADEAHLLNWTYDWIQHRLQSGLKPFPYAPEDHIIHVRELSTAYGAVESRNLSFLACVDSLQSAMLIRRRLEAMDGSNYCDLTILGWQLVEACRPPKPKEKG